MPRTSQKATAMKPKNCSSFFQNTECEYFPCHAGSDPETFNCLFCYCPLYLLGKDCGGNFTYTSTGLKDCSGCLVPHGPESAAHIARKLFGQEAE